ncbi:MAG TPA: hypothetical protein V6C72_05235, partial [Chroococcales cyanobacterium]
MPQNRKRLILAAVLSGVVFIGIALRCTRMDAAPMWLDESTTVLTMSNTNIRQTLPGLEKQVVSPQSVQQLLVSGQTSIAMMLKNGALLNFGHLPLFYLVAVPWCKCFGVGLSALRWQANLFGILQTFLTAWLCLEIFGKSTAGIAMALSSLSPLFVLYSREAREYSMWACAV